MYVCMCDSCGVVDYWLVEWLIGLPKATPVLHCTTMRAWASELTALVPQALVCQDVCMVHFLILPPPSSLGSLPPPRPSTFLFRFILTTNSTKSFFFFSVFNFPCTQTHFMQTVNILKHVLVFAQAPTCIVGTHTNTNVDSFSLGIAIACCWVPYRVDIKLPAAHHPPH